MNTCIPRLAALAAAGLAGGLIMLTPRVAQASPTVPHDPRPPAGIGPGQVIVLRPHRADLFKNRAVARVVPLPSGAVSIETLVRAIGDERWATLSDGVATLKAGILQRPNTQLRVGPSVRLLRLTDSATSPAYLSGTSATVVLTGVTVVSWDGTGPAPESDHRPYVRYTHGSSLVATGTTFQALGSRSSTAHPGVTIGSTAAIVATDTTFRGSGRGLDTYRAGEVKLVRVTASGNGGAGIVVDQAKAATLTGVTTAGNATGLVLHGPLPSLDLSGGAVHSDHNSGVGVTVSGLGKVPVGPFHTDHNATGLLVRQCPDCVLTGVSSTADRRGVTIDRSSPGALLRDSSVREAVDIGVNLAARGAHLVHVDAGAAANGTAVRLTANAGGAGLDGGTVSGGRVGVSIGAPATSITGVTVNGSAVGISVRAPHGAVAGATVTRARVGISVNATAATVTGTTVRDSTIGLNLRGHATVVNSTVADAAEAVRVGAYSQVELTKAVLGAHVLGLRVPQSANVTLTDSTVNAPLGARGNVRLVGDTHFPALPLSWLGVFALVALTIAILLELTRKLRERGHPDSHVTAPAHVTNTT